MIRLLWLVMFSLVAMRAVRELESRAARPHASALTFAMLVGAFEDELWQRLDARRAGRAT